MRLFKREPVIYDLWADIRVCWILADYFDAKWASLNKLKKSFMDNPFPASDSEPIYKMYTYRPRT